jgi:hypothetical protein
MTIQELISRCKASVTLTVNAHRDVYETVSEHLHNLKTFRSCWDDIEPKTLAKMIETDTIIELQFYPHTPIGSFSIFHYDLQAALDEAEECLQPS